MCRKHGVHGERCGRAGVDQRPFRGIDGHAAERPLVARNVGFEECRERGVDGGTRIRDGAVLEAADLIRGAREIDVEPVAFDGDGDFDGQVGRLEAVVVVAVGAPVDAVGQRSPAWSRMPSIQAIPSSMPGDSKRSAIISVSTRVEPIIARRSPSRKCGVRQLIIRSCHRSSRTTPRSARRSGGSLSPSWKISVAAELYVPAAPPPMSDWCARLHANATSVSSTNTGRAMSQSGRWLPPAT